jgi:hypothetical protein
LKGGFLFLFGTAAASGGGSGSGGGFSLVSLLYFLPFFLSPLQPKNEEVEIGSLRAGIKRGILFSQLRADEYQTLDGTGYWKLSPHT